MKIFYLSKMIRSLIRNYILYDGSEDKFYGNHEILLDEGFKIEFSINSLKKLDILSQTYNVSILHKILSVIPDIVKVDLIPELIIYKNKEGLSTYWNEIENYIIVVSLGEIQPGRFKINLECVIKKTDVIPME